jgi:Dual specificity phosphatase, catalytic domain
MSKYIKFLNAGTKVLYDKTADYLAYYAGWNGNNETDSDESDDNKNDDTIQDYDGLLKIESYEDENNSTRIFRPVSYYSEYSTFFSYPTLIVDNIFLGSAFNAASYDTLKDLKIKVIMNATSEISDYYPDDDFIYLRYKLYDNNKHSIKRYLEKAYNDIKYHQQNTKDNILIHCFMGASRSASIVIYYLMKTQKHTDGTSFSFDDAINYVKEKRNIVNPTFKLTKDLASSIMSKEK